MKSLGHYAKKFMIGMAIGAGVFSAMSLFGGLSLLTFVAPNPLTNLIYATLFFGAINTSGAIMNDLFGGNPPSQANAPTSRILSREPAEATRVASVFAGAEKDRGSHVARLQAQSEAPLQR